MIGPTNGPSIPGPSETPAEARRAETSFELVQQAMENAEKLKKVVNEGIIPTAMAAVLNFYLRERNEVRARLVAELDDYEAKPLNEDQDVEHQLAAAYHASIDVIAGESHAAALRLAVQLKEWEAQVGLGLLGDVAERISRCWGSDWTREQKIAFVHRVIEVDQSDETARRLDDGDAA